MTSTSHLTHAADAQARIDGASTERCDLEMLLRDEWRHRIAIRDDDVALRPSAGRTLSVTGAEHAAVRSALAGQPTWSLGALAMTAVHSAIRAYGHGHRTVVAFADLRPDGPGADRVLPVLVDHDVQAEQTCAAAVQDIARDMADEDSFIDADELLYRGLFDVMLLLAQDEAHEADLPWAPLRLVVRESTTGDGDALEWTLSYAEDLFEEKVIAGVLDVVRHVLGQLVARPRALVADIELVSENTRRRLDEWNDTTGPFPRGKRLTDLVDEAVERTPDAVAVVCGDRSVTYRRLSDRANEVAHWLMGPAAQLRAQQLVGLYLDKSELGVMATLGIWKAGAAYVPIDPAYPAERVRFLVGDTGLAAVLTNRHHAERVREILGERHDDVQVIEIESVLEDQEGAPDEARRNPDLRRSSEDIAYVTYTSGTTGVPKGVPKFHSSVVNSITDLAERYDMRRPGTERVAMYASYVFEPHLRQTLMALVNSQTLVIVPESVRLDPDRFPEYLAEHGVTYLNATGSVLQHFDLGRCTTLKKVLLVGEELTTSGLRQLRRTYDGTIINEYAFSEAAFVTAVKEFSPGTTERTDRSIGRPVRNVTWYVLSQNMKRLPIGAIGELFIGGCGVAPGYLNRDDLTAERFSDNPFQSEQDKALGQNARIYKTGDLARFLPNGEVEFMGRSDFQLKLNGVRVEPGEIEAQATEFPGVRTCTVIAREGRGGADDRHLVGYYVTDRSADVPERDLLTFLQDRLIRAMIPARMVELPSIPTNINGKVDWRALPDVQVHTPAATDTGAPGRDADVDPGAEGGQGVDGSGLSAPELVEHLRQIWASTLGVPVEHIGEDDNYFRLGGQSISSILLISKVRRQLGLSVAVEDVFETQTLGELATRLAGRSERADTPETTPLPAPGGSTELLANGLQQGLLYHSLRNSGQDDAYVMQSVYRYHVALRPELMHRAWQLCREKYPSLRVRFEWNDEPVQVIDDPRPVDWRYVDLTGEAATTGASGEAWIRELQERDRSEPYDPASGQLFRVHLVKQADELYSLLFSCHHVIMDGWSLPLLHDEVHRTYLRLVAGESVDLDPDEAYVAAQQHWAQHRGDHVEFWNDQIERIDERGDFGGLLNERSRYQVSLADYDHVREHRTRTLRLGRERTDALVAMCATHRVTLHSVLQFVWHKVLHTVGGGNTTVVGTIFSGRNVPVDGIEDSVGLFINTLPLVVDHEELEARSSLTAISQIQSLVNTMSTRTTVELGRLRAGDLKRRLFDTLLVLENYPRLLEESEQREHDRELRFEKVYDADKVDHPLAVVAREEDGELTVTLWYAGELFDDDAIATLLDVTETLFGQLAADVSTPVRDLEVVSPPMARQLDEWNRTQAPFPADATLHGVFEDVAARWPDEVAVVSGSCRWTYRELDERANRVAHLLGSLGVGRGDIVGLVLDKSELMVAAIIGVWKAGAALVPVDPEYPDDRVAFMLSDTEADVVLTNEEYAAWLASLPASDETGADETGDGTAGAGSRRVVALETVAWDDLSAADPQVGAVSTDLAYAIYTSGTTGRPKAVLVEHQGVVNLQVSLADQFRLGREHGQEAFLSFSNYVFDHFYEQFTDALLNGQKLVVLDDDMRVDTQRLYRYIDDEQVTYLSGTPSVLSLYDYSTTPSLTRIDAIGEDFTEPVFSKIRSTFGGTIINGYGPTEVSITSHKRPYPPSDHRVNKSIGHLVRNITAYVLDEHMHRVPVGAIGELYLGGIGVTRGYLHRDDLTAERFVANPHQTQDERERGENARIYKTGDLARWLPDGEVEYLGRTDLQVKIRGQRIELGEIEAALTSFPGIVRSLVIAREHPAGPSGLPEKYLAGFYVLDPDAAHGRAELDEAEIKEWIGARLPQSWVPAKIVRITDIPVTKSGKLDAARLPDTSFQPQDAREYLAPRSDLEVALVGIWSRVLDIGADRIGIDDDFFALGGDSIRAMALAQGITAAFGHGLGVETVLQRTTIAGQAAHVHETAASRDGADLELWSESAASLVEDAPVSLAQERLLFIDEFEGGTFAYNIPFVLRLTRNEVVTRDRVRQALRTLLRRHPALRTLVRTGADGVRRQHVLAADDDAVRAEVPVHVVADAAELDRRLTASAEHVFALGHELPLRAELFRLADGDDLHLSLVFHHSCFDGWSWDIVHGELMALLRDPGAALPEPNRATYADYAVWQRRYLSAERTASLTRFWTDRLAGHEPLRMPLDSPRPARFDYRGRELEFTLDPETTQTLRGLAKASRVSLYSVLLGGWSLVLSTYTGQRDIIVGTPSANRGRPEFDRVVGLFANLLALRIAVSPEATVGEFVRSVGETVMAAQVHAELPFEQLVKEIGAEPDPSRHPVIQVNFTLQNVAERSAQGRVGQDDGVEVEVHQPDNDGWTTTKFDLSTTLFEDVDRVSGNLTYAAALFDDATARGLIETYTRALSELARLSARSTESTLGDVLWTSAPQQAIEATPADTRSALPAAGADATLHGVFQDVASRWPDEVAVASGSCRWTYRELDERANRVAHLLGSLGVGRGDFVGLVLDKSELMVAAIIGVWKAGAAYVPVDPEYPDDRVAFMLSDTEADVVLANEEYAAWLASLPASDETGAGESGAGSRQVVALETVSWDDLCAADPQAGALSTDLAYAIYTSGTTGRPKAVLVEHRSVVGLREELRERYFGPAEEARQGVLLLANYVFDFSVEQLVLSLLGGHRLILPQQRLAHESEEFYELAAREGLSYMSGTPTQIQQFDLTRLPDLKNVLVAGEGLHEQHFDAIRAMYDGPLYNAYGTTETTVYNTVKRFEPGEAYEQNIGDPLGNSQPFVLDDRLRLLPEGAVGELYLAGGCVAAGYLNRPELTAERFVPNPFRADAEGDEHATLYRTGDLVRQRAHGGLQYMGRNDSQVKINGIRIELGEVEAALAATAQVREAAVVPRSDAETDGRARLVGYYVAEEGVQVDEDVIMAEMRSSLMPSMVPSALVRLEESLPLTVNGKLDTAALPDVTTHSQRRAHTPPRSRAEARLCQLWEAQLPGGSVGIDDDFFRVGGDSISALHLASRLQRELERKVSVKDVFDFPTVRLFADNVLTRATGASGPSTRALPVEPPRGECPMLPIQEWFFAKPLTERACWNQTFAIHTPQLDVDRLEAALQQLVEHHDAFRLRFPGAATSRDDAVPAVSPSQRYAEDTPHLTLHEVDVAALSEEQVHATLAGLQDGFDLEAGPTACAAYLHGFGDGTARVWFGIHHLVVDSVSWRILMQDLEILYHGGELEEASASYADWARAVQDYRPGEAEREFWSEVQADLEATPALRPDSATGLRTRTEIVLDEERTQALLTECGWAYDTDIDELLLTAVGCALARVTGRAKSQVTVEGHGRESFDGSPEIRDTMGWFTTMHPFPLDVDEGDLAGSIRRTRASRRRIPHHGVGYGALHGRYGSAGAPIANVSYNYLGRLGTDQDGPGVDPAVAGWRLDAALSGSHTTEDNRAANDSVVDLTLSCVDGRLVTQVDSVLGAEVTAELVDGLRWGLESVVDHTASIARRSGRAGSRPSSGTRAGTPGAGEDPAAEFDPYVLVGAEHAESTVFVLPPGEGGAESYLGNLAKGLPGQRLVLFNNVHLHSPMGSFEELARYYLELVRGLQPYGPYRFVGWSFGGVLSVEMSRQLALAGERIEVLALIDPYFAVREASESIGLGEVEDILDPINYHYRPATDDLAVLRRRLGEVVLFKATEPNEIIHNEHQPELFEAYRRSAFNGLDRLLPDTGIEVQHLRGETHHSWVRNDEVVRALTTRLSELVQRRGED